MRTILPHGRLRISSSFFLGFFIFILCILNTESKACNGLAYLKVNGVAFEHFSSPPNRDFFLSDPCKIHQYCLDYYNEDNFSKQVTFMFSFPPNATIINTNGFVQIASSPYPVYEYTTTVAAYDVINVCMDFMVAPDWNGIAYLSQVLASIITDCNPETYLFVNFDVTGPNLEYVNLNGGTQTWSQILINNPFLNIPCSGSGGIGGFVLNGHIEMDMD